jgi:hypothetical protein
MLQGAKMVHVLTKDKLPEISHKRYAWLPLPKSSELVFILVLCLAMQAIHARRIYGGLFGINGVLFEIYDTVPLRYATLNQWTTVLTQWTTVMVLLM